MDLKVIKKFKKIKKSGHYYRRLKKNRENCEEYLKTLYSMDNATPSSSHEAHSGIIIYNLFMFR